MLTHPLSGFLLHPMFNRQPFCEGRLCLPERSKQSLGSDVDLSGDLLTEVGEHGFRHNALIVFRIIPAEQNTDRESRHLACSLTREFSRR